MHARALRLRLPLTPHAGQLHANGGGEHRAAAQAARPSHHPRRLQQTQHPVLGCVPRCSSCSAVLCSACCQCRQHWHGRAAAATASEAQRSARCLISSRLLNPLCCRCCRYCCCCCSCCCCSAASLPLPLHHCGTRTPPSCQVLFKEAVGGGKQDDLVEVRGGRAVHADPSCVHLCVLCCAVRVCVHSPDCPVHFVRPHAWPRLLLLLLPCSTWWRSSRRGHSSAASSTRGCGAARSSCVCFGVG